MRKVGEVLRKHTEFIRTEEDGVETLAYPIDGHDKGDYIYYDIVIREEDAPRKISSALNVEDTVIRYLLTRVDYRKKPEWAKEYENLMAEATA